MGEKEKLLELADRCEGAAAEDQYRLLEDAFALCFPENYMPGRSGFGPHKWSDFEAKLNAYAFESAAMTLVPEGWFVRITSAGNCDIANSAWLTEEGDQQSCYVDAATPALALTAAVLRARAAQSEESDRG